MKASERLHITGNDCAPPWKRWLALLSVVLLVLVPQAHSVLQHGVALHLSQRASPATSTAVIGQDSRLTDEDTPCTLCSVLGSATQLASYQATGPVQQTFKVAPFAGRVFVPEQWDFDQLSRPPPGNAPGESAAG